ncbi:Atu1372/SO_1960 family protein [Candidatus Uabimicrobium sp. HlEnr_7]|uniref:Atu1372/SO_1960 family protein n=1 Tax=Candidatus Uabimicrobium helgolandensis TaxID=3095367 RepID=UPI0035587654
MNRISWFLVFLVLPLFADNNPYNPEKKLADMDITLFKPSKPAASFVPAVRTGNLVFLSGHVPRKPEGGYVTGKVGKDLTTAQAKDAARLTAVSLLSSLKNEIGNLQYVKRIVKVTGMVNATPSFTEHSLVINGCSDLLISIFGEKGRHARAAVGMSSLPFNFAVEIEMIVEIGDKNYCALVDAINSSERTQTFISRDQYRHPLETLTFFGIKRSMSVAEVWPGSSAWYMEVLAPYLREEGLYIAAGFDQETKSDFFKKANAKFAEKLKSKPQLFDKVKVSELAAPHKTAIAPAGTLDAILTFRNVHNWMWSKSEQDMFRAFYKALKPGGILGVIEHRAPETTDDIEAKRGYVKESYTLELAKKAGFKFVASSDINNNPKDITTYPTGVWTLPPTLRLKEKDREKYMAIGESDRFTLKFIKPKTAK